MCMIYMGCFQADTRPRSKSEKEMTIWCLDGQETGSYCQEDLNDRSNVWKTPEGSWRAVSGKWAGSKNKGEEEYRKKWRLSWKREKIPWSIEKLKPGFERRIWLDGWRRRVLVFFFSSIIDTIEREGRKTIVVNQSLAEYIKRNVSNSERKCLEEGGFFGPKQASREEPKIYRCSHICKSQRFSLKLAVQKQKLQKIIRLIFLSS